MGWSMVKWWPGGMERVKLYLTPSTHTSMHVSVACIGGGLPAAFSLRGRVLLASDPVMQPVISL